MVKRICASLVVLATLSCGSTQRPSAISVDDSCTLLTTANLAETPILAEGRSRPNYVLEIAHCDDFERADYYGCKGPSPRDESTYVGTIQVGPAAMPAYYVSRGCDGSNLPSVRQMTPSGTGTEPQQSTVE